MTTTATWNHLPNAQHIDHVLASLKSHPDAWAARAAPWAAARDAAWDAARAAPWAAARAAAWDAAKSAIRYAARSLSRSRAAAWAAAWDAIGALIAYDDSAKYLDMTSDELIMWAALSEDPAAILLLPAVRAFEQIKELEFT